MINITCVNPDTGEIQTVATSVEGGGGSTPEFPSFRARRLNLCMEDVRLSIDEGRMMHYPPFNLLGPGTGVDG